MKFYLVFTGACTIGFPAYEREHRSLKSVFKAVHKVAKTVDLVAYPPQVWRLNHAGYIVTN